MNLIEKIIKKLNNELLNPIFKTLPVNLSIVYYYNISDKFNNNNSNFY